MSKLKTIGDFKILDSFKKGGYGQLYLVQKGDVKKMYVLKTPKEMFKKGNEEYIKSLQKEIEILRELNKSPNNKYIPILYYFGTFHSEKIEDKKYEEYDNINNITNIDKETQKTFGKIMNLPYFVIDYYSKGNLLYYINKLEKGFPTKHAKLLFLKIVECVQFCHRNNICHLDLKPANFVFDKDFNIKIIDFGFSEFITDSKEKIKEFKGTLDYASPEILEKKEYNGFKSDIFSLGHIIYNLVVGRSDFTSARKSDRYYKYIIENKDNNYEKYCKEIKKHENFEFSDDFKELYEKMITYDPENRLTIDKILSSSWLKEIINMKEEERDKLEQDVREKLLDLFYKIKGENVELIISEKYESEGFNTRGFSKEEINEYFKDLKPKNISKDRISINHYMTIKTKLEANKFMNILIYLIDKKFGDNCTIEPSKENLKIELEITEEDDEKEEISNCIMDIELFEYEKGDYLLEFFRIEGEIPDYYHYFLEIKKIIIDHYK